MNCTLIKNKSKVNQSLVKQTFPLVKNDDENFIIKLCHFQSLQTINMYQYDMFIGNDKKE